jgi:RNA polymerase sigma factor (sigma-70 family)
MNVADDAGDADLLAALPQDVAAFEAFYHRYFERVTAFAARRCACAEDVADVVAQTFVRLLTAAERYDPARAQPAAFLFGIAANVARDLHRSDARRRVLVSKLAGRDLLDDDDIERIDAAIDAARAARAVSDALQDLPTGEREMLRLVAGGRTPGQAAAALGIQPGAAWTRLSRARQRLRHLMDETTADGPMTGENR